MEIPILTFDILGNDFKPCSDNMATSQCNEFNSLPFSLILSKVLTQNMGELLNIKDFEEIDKNFDDSDREGLQDKMKEMENIIDIENIDSFDFESSIDHIAAAISEILILIQASEFKEKMAISEDKPDFDITQKLDWANSKVKNEAPSNIFLTDKTKGLIDKSDIFIKFLPNNRETSNIKLSDLKMKTNSSISEPSFLIEDLEAVNKEEIRGILDNNFLNSEDFNFSFERDLDFSKTLTSDERQLTDYSKNLESKENPLVKDNISHPVALDISKNSNIESAMQKDKIISANLTNTDSSRFHILRMNETTLRVVVEPDGVGILDIELTLEKGVINAYIFASDGAGKNFLDNNLSNLLSNLLKDGLNIGKFSVSLGDKKNDNGNNNENERSKDSKLLEKVNTTANYAQSRMISIFA